MAGPENRPDDMNRGMGATPPAGQQQAGSGKIRDKAEQVGAAAGRKVGEALATAQESLTAATQKVQDTAGNVAQRAQEAASHFAQRARDTASAAGERAHDALSGVGQRVSSLAGTIRESAPQQGAFGTAASAVADRREAGGQYLQEQRLDAMVEDLAAVVRRHPLQALMIGFGFGCLVGMTLKRR